MLVRSVQFWKAPPPIIATDAPLIVLGRIMDPDEDLPSIKYAVFPEALIRYFMELLSSEKESPVLVNALLPIEVTLSGIVMLVRLVQSRNAQLPIEVTLSGIVMLDRLLQL